MLCRDSRLQLYGNGGKKILILIDAQDASQQSLKSYGAGDKMRIIDGIFREYGIYIDQDCWVSSVIQCFTMYPKDTNAECCKPLTDQLIEKLKPELIISFGELSSKTLLAGHISGGTHLDRVHGLLHNSRKYNCNIMFTYMPHKPTYSNTVDDLIVRRDIHRAIMSLHRQRRIWKPEKDCVRILSEAEAIDQLRECIENPVKRFAALDYETNSLRPFNERAKLLSVAISESKDDSFAFMITDKVVPYLQEYWRTGQIMKIAHNSAFERMWTAVKLRVLPRLLSIDTMLLMHVLDNRESKFLSIKFLAPMLLGSSAWDGIVSRYIDASREEKIKYGSYAINDMEKAPVRTMLTYNAIDSLVEYRVFIELKQMLDTYLLTFPDVETIDQFSVR